MANVVMKSIPLTLHLSIVASLCVQLHGASPSPQPSRPNLEPLRGWWKRCEWPLPDSVKTSLPAWVAAHPEDAEAAFFLATLASRRIEGFTEVKDPVDLLRRSAGAGFVPAIARLGYLTAAGVGVPADSVAGMKMLQVAAEANDPDGIMNLGLLSLEGTGGTPVDLNKAESLIRKSLDRGHIRAHAYLAKIQEAKGEPLLAFRYVEAGANAGDPNSMALLGECYRQGSLIARSDDSALLWMRAAAERGSSEGQRHLAEMLYEGIGTTPDAQAGFAWAFRAAGAGNGKAIKIVVDAYLSGEGTQRNSSLAIKLLSEMAERQDVGSQLRLGKLYLEGLLVERNVERARQYFTLAANAGDRDAALYLEWIRRAEVN